MDQSRGSFDDGIGNSQPTRDISPAVGGSSRSSEFSQRIEDVRTGSPERLSELFDDCRKYLLLVAKVTAKQGFDCRISPDDLVRFTFDEARRIFDRFEGKTEQELLHWLVHILEYRIVNPLIDRCDTPCASIKPGNPPPQSGEKSDSANSITVDSPPGEKPSPDSKTRTRYELEHFLQQQQERTFAEAELRSDSQTQLLGQHTRILAPGSKGDVQSIVGFSENLQSAWGIRDGRLGRFEILRALGAGGHGVVFLARDPILDRLVAIKVPKTDWLLNPSLRARFLIEGRAAALLLHPNIVTIFESNEVGAVCYLAQDYVPGPSLAAWLEEHPDPVAPRVAAAFVLQLADALSAAHERGILHRDIKPGNILLAPLPTAEIDSVLDAYVPKLVDFGLAKFIESMDAPTCSGTILGTPAYMSPEQAAGHRAMIRETTDIYSLGAIFFELLTHRRVYQGENSLEIICQIAKRDPDHPRRAISGVPKDLDAVCMKCLSREPADRYSSAKSMADDLRRFLDGRPVIARPLSTFVLLSRWSRRHPATALLWGLVVVLTLITLSSALWYASELNQYNARLNTSLELIERQDRSLKSRTEALRRRVYGDDLGLAAEAWQDGNINEARRRLAACLPDEGESDLRSFPWWMLAHTIENSSQVIGSILPGAAAAPLLVTPAKDSFLCGEPDGVLRIRSLPAGQLLYEMKGHAPGLINSLHLSAYGQTERVVSAGDDGSVRVWDLKDRRELIVIPAHKGRAMTARFLGKDAAAIASGGEDHVIRIWETATGRLISELIGHTNTVRALVEQSTTGTLYSSAEDQTIRLWKWKTGHFDDRLPDGKLPIPISAGWARVLALSPNDVDVAAGFRSGRLIQWTVKDGHRKFGVPYQDSTFASGVRALDWINDQTLAVGFADSRIAIGRGADDFHDVFSGHTDWILSLAVASDAGGMITSSKDGAIRYWPADEIHGQIRIPARLSATTSTPFWNGETLLVCVNEELFGYRMPDRTLKFHFDIDDKIGGAWMALSADGRRCLTSEKTDEGSAFSAFRTDSGERDWQIATGNDYPRIGSLSPDGKTVYVSIRDEIWSLDIQTGRRMNVCKHPFEIMDLVCIPDSSQVATVSKDGRIRIWDPINETVIREWRGHLNSAQKIAVSPDGTRFATSGEDMLVHVWGVSDGTETTSFAVNVELESLFLVDDGNTVVTYGNNQLRFWSISERAEITRCSPFPNVSYTVLSPDRKIFAVQYSRHIRLLSGTPLEQKEPFPGHSR